MSAATAAPTASHWTLERDADGVAWLTLDRKDASANSLSRAVMEELDAHIDSLRARRQKALIVTSGKTSGFIAGADITRIRRDANSGAGVRHDPARAAGARSSRRTCPALLSPRSTASRWAEDSKSRWHAVIASSPMTRRSRLAFPKSARCPSGTRRNGARRATCRADCCDGSDAHRPLDSSEEGAAVAARRSRRARCELAQAAQEVAF